MYELEFAYILHILIKHAFVIRTAECATMASRIQDMRDMLTTKLAETGSTRACYHGYLSFEPI